MEYCGVGMASSSATTPATSLVDSTEIPSSAHQLAPAEAPPSAAAAAMPPHAEGSFSREVYLFTASGSIFIALAALTQVITKGWPAIARSLFAPFAVCVMVILAAGSIAVTTMSNQAPALHFLAKVAARVSLIFGIMILEIPFIQMAAGLSAVVLMPVLLLATLVILGYIWWCSETEIVCSLCSLLCPCFLRHRQVQVTPQPLQDIAEDIELQVQNVT